MTLIQAIEAQPKARIYGAGVCLVLLIGAVDYVTPYEISLFMFYTGPVLLVAWCGSRRAAVLLALFSVLIAWMANLPTQPWPLQVYAWRGINNVIPLVLVAIGGSAMRARQNMLEAHVNELERARLLEEEILRVSEREQMRMGQDLHDGLCQHLAGISCAMQCLAWEISGQSASAMDSAAFIQEQLRDAARDARDLARGAFPVQMNADGHHGGAERAGGHDGPAPRYSRPSHCSR